MDSRSDRNMTGLLPSVPRLRRGLALSVVLWLTFLILTAYTSAATLFDRIDSTDVMRAASHGAWTGTITFEVGWFLFVQLLLHVAFAALTWALACATASLSATARAKFAWMVLAWFSVLAAATLAYNALWYPRTLIGAYYSGAMSTLVGPWSLGQCIYTLGFGLAALVATGGTALRLHRLSAVGRRRAVFSIGAALAVPALAIAWPHSSSSGAASSAAVDRPHIIVLGIDSLRLENLARFGGNGSTPNLDAFLADATVFRDTTTPAARTFSSWTAILTGRAPRITGARFNLAERSSVSANPTIADALRQYGYRTVYSTDEVRFANIDESYGFDDVVTPRIGAADFLVGTYNELPLASLFVNHRIGKFLFPFSYANRGVATMFHPESYVERIRREVEFDRPTFFISHLTAAHWPYYTASTPFSASKYLSEQDRPLYRVGLRTADKMFGELMEILEQKGALKNAIVVLLSDHGEALGLQSDSFFADTFRVEGLRAPIKMNDFGHGQSVLSKTQYQVLLSFRAFGPDRGFGTVPLDVPALATVEDIAPTLLNMIGLSSDLLEPSGRSMLPLMGTDGAVIHPADLQRIRFTETDLSVLPAPGGGVDEVGTARENSKFFEVDPETARLHIRPIFAPLALAYKERAAFTKHQLLAALPAGPYAHQYLYIDFEAQRGRLLMARPADDVKLPDAQRLWDALHQQYGQELKPPADITPADWPRINEEWTHFVVDERSSRKGLAQAR
jgi:hypothetical protein